MVNRKRGGEEDRRNSRLRQGRGVSRAFRFLSGKRSGQPSQASGKAKELAACNLQTASSFSRLNGFGHIFTLGGTSSSGLLFKGIAAARTGDADLSLAARDAHDLPAARAAEESIILSLAEAAFEQPERAEKAVPVRNILPVFLAPGCDLPRENAHIAPDEQCERRRGEYGREESALPAHSDGEENAYTSAYGKKPAEHICAVPAGHEGGKISVGGTTLHKKDLRGKRAFQRPLLS